MEQFKFKPILGSLPEDTSWWTEEQWESHRKEVEKLKAEGRYLTEGEEITINYDPKDFEWLTKGIKEPFSNPQQSLYYIPFDKESEGNPKIQIKYNPNK